MEVENNKNKEEEEEEEEVIPIHIAHLSLYVLVN
jgi:hypothetical protein